MKINLHIERLVLQDMDVIPGQERAIYAAIQSELHQHFAIPGTDVNTTSTANRGVVKTRTEMQGNGRLPGDLGRAIGSTVGRIVSGGPKK